MFHRGKFEDFGGTLLRGTGKLAKIVCTLVHTGDQMFWAAKLNCHTMLPVTVGYPPFSMRPCHRAARSCHCQPQKFGVSLCMFITVGPMKKL